MTVYMSVGCMSADRKTIAGERKVFRTGLTVLYCVLRPLLYPFNTKQRGILGNFLRPFFFFFFFCFLLFQTPDFLNKCHTPIWIDFSLKFL
jgi:hypothetical protein